MTDGVVYADDVIDLEVMESIASSYEKERDKRKEMTESKLKQRFNK